MEEWIIVAVSWSENVPIKSYINGVRVPPWALLTRWLWRFWFWVVLPIKSRRKGRFNIR